MSRRHRRRRGYTVVELMMALTVLAIGVTGIIAMQKVTLNSNRDAKSFAIAAQIAQAWVDQLSIDAVQWNYPSQSRLGVSDLTDTTWLSRVGSSGSASSGWFLPAYSTTQRFGGAFDALGNPVSDYSQAVFCTHVRLQWLSPDGAVVSSPTSTTGNGLIRTEVRVFWLKSPGTSPATTDGFCPSSMINDVGWATTVGRAVDRYQFVYQASAVRQNTGA